MKGQDNNTTTNLIHDLVNMYDAYLHQGNVPAWLQKTIDGINHNNPDLVYEGLLEMKGDKVENN